MATDLVRVNPTRAQRFDAWFRLAFGRRFPTAGLGALVALLALGGLRARDPSALPWGLAAAGAAAAAGFACGMIAGAARGFMAFAVRCATPQRLQLVRSVLDRVTDEGLVGMVNWRRQASPAERSLLKELLRDAESTARTTPLTAVDWGDWRPLRLPDPDRLRGLRPGDVVVLLLVRAGYGIAAVGARIDVVDATAIGAPPRFAGVALDLNEPVEFDERHVIEIARDVS